MKISLNARRSIIASAAGTVIAAYGIGKPAAASTTLYWDAYGATPVASYGVWDSADTGNNIWNSDSNISSGSVLTNWPAASTALTNDVAYFNYNTTNAGIQTVNVSGGVSTLQITEQAGSVSFYGVTSSSPSLTIGGSGITCTGNQVGQYMYFDASLGKVLISGSQEWDYNTGQTRNWTFNASVGSLATAGQTQALYVWTGGGPQTFNGAITDGAGGGKLQLSRMITGGSVWATTINAANTYSGGTVADSGLLWFGSAATAGSGPVYIGAGDIHFQSSANFNSANYAYNGQTGFLVGPLGGIGIGSLAPTGVNAGTLPIDPHSSGYVSLDGQNYGGSLNMSSGALGNGSMFFGATGETNVATSVVQTYTGAALIPGNNNTYRLGAGGGTLNISNGVLTGANAVVIGMPNYNVIGSAGYGTVNLASTSVGGTYTGGTTVNLGSMISGNVIPGTTTFGTGAITLNSGKISLNGLSSTNATTTLGDITFNGTAQILGAVTPAPGFSTTISIGGPSDVSPLTRSNQGVLQIATSGSGNVLGSGTGINVMVTNSAVAPVVTNGIVAPYFQDGSGNFLTYGANGFAPDSTSVLLATGATGTVNYTSAALNMTGTQSVNSLVLSGNLTNTTSGAAQTLTINSGGLSATATATIGSTTAAQAINLNFGTAEAILGGTASTTIDNAISNSIASAGSPGLTIANKGATVTLAGVNTFTGLVTINGGSTLSVNTDAALGNINNGVLINGGTLVFNTTGITTARTITFGNEGAFVNAANTTVQNLNGLITTGGSGTSANFLDFNSGVNTARYNLGNTSLVTPNDFTAPIYLEGRITLGITQDAQLGNAANTLTFNAIDNTSNSTGSPTLLALSSLTTNRSIVTTGATSVGSILNTNASGVVLTATGNIAGDASMIFNSGSTNTGAVVLTGTNTYFGTTSIPFGTLQIGNGGASGTLGQGTVTSNGVLAFNRNNSYSVTSVVSGTGVINQIGTGSTTFTQANTYTGVTNISAGTLIVANTTGSGTGTGNVWFKGGTLASGTTGNVSGMVLYGPGTIAPGGVGSIGTLLIGGLNTNNSSPALTINFDLGTGTGPEISNGDQLTLTGATANVASGTLITFGTNPTTGGVDYRLIGDTASGATVASINLSHFTLPNAPSGVSYALSNGGSGSVDPGYIDLVVSTSGPNNLLFNNTSPATGDGTSFATGSSSPSYQNFQNMGASNAASYFTAGDNVTFSDNNNGNYNVTVVGVVAPGSTTFSSTGNYNFGGGSINGSGGLTKTLGGTLTLSSANGYLGATNVAGGSLVLAAAGALPSGTALTIGSNASVLSNNLAATFVVSSLTNNGLLDLANNKLVVHGGMLGTLSTQVGQGFASGAWNGPTGIASVAAAADSTHLTALGVIQDSNDGTTSGTPLYTTFGTATGLTATDVLVKYTYYGDANLDGTVDASDYSRIDSGFITPGATGWFNGDFNYDGVINGSDYTLIDNAFNTQGATISASLASPLATDTAEIAGSSAVPEPAMLGLLGISALGILGRRRRRI